MGDEDKSASVDYDLIILGAGTSGLPTARLAGSKLPKDKKILLVDDGPLAGTCLNTGCTPTKCLVYATQLYQDCLTAKKFGVSYKDLKIDSAKVFNYAREIVRKGLIQNQERLDKFENITQIKYKGKFINENEIQIGNETYSGTDFVIATGTIPFIPKIRGLSEIKYHTHKTILSLEKAPESIVLVGGGFISLEYASIFHLLGTKVSIIEFAPRLIPRADESISEEITKYFLEDGINIFTNSSVTGVSPQESGGEGNNIEVYFRNNDVSSELSKILTSDIFINTGFRGNTEFLNLEAASVNTTRGNYIETNEFLQTSNPHIWAIGDVIGKTQFTHMALKESKVLVNNIFASGNTSLLKPVNFENIPYAVFTHPPIGSVGTTEAELRSKGLKSGSDYFVKTTRFSNSSKGVIMGLKRGYIKLLHDKSRILGVHIIGEDADNLIGEFIPLIKLENGWDLFKNIIHPHPTLLEIFNNLQKE